MGRSRILTLSVVLCLGVLATATETARVTLHDIKPPDFSKLIAYPVLGVTDGDTIRVSIDDKPVIVRLIGVDTPETVHPSKPVQRYGKEASRFTTNLLMGEQVYLDTEPQQGPTDRYGRTLAYVYRAPDGLFVNAEIIRQGYGHAYTQFPCKYTEEFRQLERFARQAEKGLWAEPPNKAAVPLVPARTAVRVPVKPIKPEPIGVTVYVTRTGRKYHRGSCSYLRKSKIPMSLKAAKASYGPCSRCRPPQ